MQREVKGFTDMGPIRVPYLPLYIVMEDRDDGTLWALSHGADGEHWAINDELPPAGGTDFKQYGPFDGPYIAGNSKIRLLIRGGRLGYEYNHDVEPRTGQSSGMVASRRYVQPLVNQIIVPSTWSEYGDVLGWERFYP